jgi:ATP-dependent Clp protease ATP-binding subunit ClpA
MKKLSIGTKLSWQIASLEALTANHSQIECDHMLIGILSLGKAHFFKEKIDGLSQSDKEKILKEQKSVDQLIEGFGTSPKALRRTLRAKISAGKVQSKRSVIHRSENVKICFKTADNLVKSEKEMNVLHLLAALTARPTTAIEESLLANDIEPKRLWMKARAFDPESDSTATDARDIDSIHAFSQNSNVTNLTIMFDDIVGSIALFNKLGDEEFYKIIHYHNEQVQKIINHRKKGEIIKSTGDGLLMVFSDPIVAVECALDIQKTFINHELITVRIGMDIGEVKEVHNKSSRDIFGIKVSTANRIMGAARGGHILTSKDVHISVVKELDNRQIKWKFLGSRSFKPGEPTIDIYEVFHLKHDIKPMDHLPEQPQKVPKMSMIQTPHLDKYGRDLTREAREGRLGPFAGRRNELLQVIQSLSQRYSNCPLLVGESGVGKTALVEALAVRIAEGKDAALFKKQRIIGLNIAAVLVGAQNQIEFEKRMTDLLNEVQSHPEVLLFIDEVHNFIGADRTDQLNTIASMFNQIISSGKLQFIGTTTPEYYEKYIVPDRSLERGFQVIQIQEPSRRETLEMLKIFRKKFEEYHKVWITDRALEAAVDLSVSFDPEHALPAKAIDLMDEAGAQVHVPGLSMLEDKEDNQFGVERGGAQTMLNVLSIASALSKKTGLKLNQIMEELDGAVEDQ